jgi:hypothetical protein
MPAFQPSQCQLLYPIEEGGENLWLPPQQVLLREQRTSIWNKGLFITLCWHHPFGSLVQDESEK